MPSDLGSVPAGLLRLLGAASLTLMVWAAGCAAPPETGRKSMMTGRFLNETEIQRVADLMARDMVREPIFYSDHAPPRLALVKIENNTNQYMFGSAKDAYAERMRTQLQRALGPRVVFVEPGIEKTLRGALEKWHVSEDETAALARGSKDRYGVDYLLTGSYSSLDKVVQVTGKDGKVRDKGIVELLMAFALVDAETAEIVWTNSVSSAATFTTRDFQD